MFIPILVSRLVLSSIALVCCFVPVAAVTLVLAVEAIIIFSTKIVRKFTIISEFWQKVHVFISWVKIETGLGSVIIYGMEVGTVVLTV